MIEDRQPCATSKQLSYTARPMSVASQQAGLPEVPGTSSNSCLPLRRVQQSNDMSAVVHVRWRAGSLCTPRTHWRRVAASRLASRRHQP